MEVGAGYWVKYGLSDRRSDWELRGMGTRPCARPRQRLPGGAGSTSPAHRPQTVRIRCAEPHPALSRVGYCRRDAGGLSICLGGYLFQRAVEPLRYWTVQLGSWIDWAKTSAL